MKEILERLAALPGETDALVPVTGDRTSHPPVLLPGGIRVVLAYEGEGV